MTMGAVGGSARVGPVRLVLDMARCDGHGICALRCPELVVLDRFGFAGVGGEPITDPTVQRRARRAVAACPERALSVVTARGFPEDGAGTTASLLPVLRPRLPARWLRLPARWRGATES